MSKRDFYEVLGVTRGCDDKVLKAAYRKLAMQFHPDRNNGDQTAEVKFKEISEAYECLSDPQKRAAYDRFGHAAFENGGGPAASPTTSPPRCRHLRRHLRRLHGRPPHAPATARGGRERGSDLRYNMEIRLEEAFSGKTAEIEVPTKVACEPCAGSGAKRGSAPKACPTCDGHGRVRAARASSRSSAPARPARAAAR